MPTVRQLRPCPNTNAASARGQPPPESAFELTSLFLLDDRTIFAQLASLAEQANRPDLAAEFRQRGGLTEGKPSYSPSGNEDPSPETSQNGSALSTKLPLPQPPSAIAIVRVGISLLGKGQLADAVEKLREAVRLDPNLHEAHANLGVALAQSGQVAAAESSFRDALRLRPTANVWNNLGTACVHQRKPAEAEEAFQQALRLEPKNPEHHRHLGTLLEGRGQNEAAEAAFREAVAHGPTQPEGHFCLGKLLEKLGRFADAESCFREATHLRPAFSPYWSSLGRCSIAQNKAPDAESAYRVAIGLEPNNAELHSNLGVALAGQRRMLEAEAAYRKALELAPAMAMVHNNLGNGLRMLDRADEGANHLREAIRLHPHYAEAHNNLGIYHTQERRIAEGKACYDEAIRLRPDYPEAHLNRSLCWLGEGDFPRGWPEYEWRLKLPNRRHPEAPFPRWEGAPLNGRTLLLLAEQGLGDAVQFMRFAALIPRGHSGRVVLDCPKELVDLAKTCPGIDTVVPRGEALPKCDAMIPLLSIPCLFGTSLSTIPAQVPYLKCDPRRVDYWRGQLEALPGLRVGIAWQGSLDHREDRWRSISLPRFKAIAGNTKSGQPICLCSLQKGKGAEQLNDGSAAGLIVYDFGAQTGASFADTAALMQALDLIVTVDTSIAHVAGALGLPVWVILPAASDWRWLIGREDSPWYPTMRLFRQANRGDWDEVFERIGSGIASIL